MGRKKELDLSNVDGWRLGTTRHGLRVRREAIGITLSIKTTYRKEVNRKRMIHQLLMSCSVVQSTIAVDKGNARKVVGIKELCVRRRKGFGPGLAF